MTLTEVKRRIKDLDEQQTVDVVCALIGHSRIETTYSGYHYCARCHAQVGDTLASTYDNSKSVIVGHGCKLCKENYAKMDWHHKFMAPDPFEEKKDE